VKISLVLILFVSLLFGDEVGLNNLLSQYREAGELYKETKEEKSGHIIVFSRSDLDKMQAYTLNDVLKTVRMFTLKSTKFGMTSLVKSPYSEQSMSSIKIFINSYELTSITAGTGLAQYGKMGLNFIDHIEIYQASNTIITSGEPGNMIIKMYTKDPTRENATVAQASVDSKAGSRVQLIEGKSFDEYSYLANIDVSKNNYDDYRLNNNSELSKDGYRGQFYLNFSKKDDYEIEAGSASEKDDLFAGFGRSIIEGGMDMKSYYAQFTKYFDNDIKLILSTSYETVKLTNSDNVGFALLDNSISKNLLVKTGSYTNSAILEKKYNYKNNSFLFGTQVKLKNFFLDGFKSEGVAQIENLGPKHVDFYALFFEDAYDINENHQITLGAKLDHYENHYNGSSTEDVLRFAYIGRVNENFALKSFIQEGYVYPIFAQTTFAPIYNPNPYLKSVNTSVIKVESEYKKDNLTLILGGGTSKSKNGIIYDGTKKMYVNNSQNSDFKQFNINATYKFNADNKVITEYFKTFKENAHFSPEKGILVQLYNRVNKFDIYNELVYRSSYTGTDGIKMDAGYDYTAGVIYNYSKHLDLKLKGENIFDTASQSSIYGIKIPALERRAIFTMEYMF